MFSIFKNHSFYSDFPEIIHLEITDRCNAACPQCGRNKLGGEVNPYLSQTELKLEDLKKMLPPKLVKRLKRLYMCGNFGDPLMASDTLEVFKYLRENGQENLSLGMNTNGSARDHHWWRELGEVFGKNGNVKFGIDGLGDTHEIYRRKTNFDKILKNAQSFISVGGRAHWEYLVFKHNEHQVEEARELSKELGFEKFTLKKTGRFFSNTRVKTNDFQNVFKEDGSLDYIIEKPDNPSYQNKSLERENNIIEKFGSMDTYLDKTDVVCKVQEDQGLYISAEGLVFPCCWTANQLYLWYMPPKSGQIWKLINQHGGVDSINATKVKIEKIIRGNLFKSIKSSWSCSSVKEGKLKVCAKTCGTLFDQFKDQYR